ncbi:hypothetical protein DBR10_17070 [Caulobacter sp. HMWF025]|nr:hypothetical protein DBR10_17070 [Caulobacter sp. HMWF025]
MFLRVWLADGFAAASGRRKRVETTPFRLELILLISSFRSVTETALFPMNAESNSTLKSTLLWSIISLRID